MVLVSQPFEFQTCTSIPEDFNGIPEIDFSNPIAGKLIVKACEEIGFFKLLNHGVPVQLSSRLEDEAVSYFGLPQMEKEKFPTVYGSKYIGRNGDVGWLEFLLFTILPSENLPSSLMCFVNEYVGETRGLASRVLDLISAELRISPMNKLSDLINEKKNDCCFRINYYPPCSARNLIGFGEHTDPQLISVARSNSIEGLQIQFRDGAWVSIPPDQNALFFNVGDCLQVMTKGRFRSVKHRVVLASDARKPRVSMIFFGAPPLNAKITALIEAEEDEKKGTDECRYEEFTWSDYKRSCYMTRFSDDRLGRYKK